MTLTYYGVLLNIMIALLRVQPKSNEHEDLLILQDIANDDNHSGAEAVDIDALLQVFRDKTHLRVSIEDLYVYFSNMEVFKV